LHATTPFPPDGVSVDDFLSGGIDLEVKCQLGTFDSNGQPVKGVRIQLEPRIVAITEMNEGLEVPLTGRTVRTKSSGLVIGGLLDDMQQEVADKVPALGDLPYLGMLFRAKAKGRKPVGLIFMTCQVVAPAQ
jgi:general secretion pathway protein D